MSEITHKQHLTGWQDGSPHSLVNTLGLSWSRKVRGLLVWTVTVLLASVHTVS